MRNMRNVLALVLALVMLLCSTALADTLRVGMECNYAPYNWTQAEESEYAVPLAAGGYADGYDVRIARRIADALGMDLEIVKIEWDGLTMALMSGKIDAIIAGMSPTEERKLTIDFTDPYYESDLVMVVRKDGAYAEATSLADFAGARITGQLNTFHYAVIDQIPDVKKQTAMETFPAMIVALNAGAIDGYVSERPGAVSAVTANPELTFVSFNEGEGFAASPEDVAALAEISREERQQIMDDAVAAQPLSE